MKGYLFDSNLKKCFKCPNGCQYCSNRYSCDVCNDGFFLLSNSCEKCIKDCKKCNGFYEQDCYEWYLGDYMDEDTFIDDEINNNCACKAESLSNNLLSIISLIILSILL